MIALDAEAIYRDFSRHVREMRDAAAWRDARLVGIRTGGVWLAQRLREELGIGPPVGLLDISFYRDDFSRTGLNPSVKPSSIGFDVDGADILLVDDVLYTGRTIRAAMNELFDYGRPARIELAVLIDRGGRELPIAASIVGRTLQVPGDVNVVLSRAAGGALSLKLEQKGK